MAHMRRRATAAGGRVTPTMGSLKGRRRPVLRRVLLVVSVLSLAAVAGVGTAAAATAHRAHDVLGDPVFGPNVVVFNPSMPQSEIQARLDQIANQQVPNQFGSQRYAILFEPGTYGRRPTRSTSRSATTPRSPGSARARDVVINGAIDVFNQCTQRLLHRAGQLLALAVEPDPQRRPAEPARRALLQRETRRVRQLR